MKKIILDTNVLLAIDEFKLDLFSVLKRDCNFSFTLYVVQETISELVRIKEEERAKYARAAKLALSLLKAKKVKILDDVKGTQIADDSLVEYSKQGYLVLTQDVGLKKRLQKPYLTIRQKRKIWLVE